MLTKLAMALLAAIAVLGAPMPDPANSHGGRKPLFPQQGQQSAQPQKSTQSAQPQQSQTSQQTTQQVYNGDRGSYYDPTGAGTGAYGGCGWQNQGSERVVAMNAQQYEQFGGGPAGGGPCGKMVVITDKKTGKTATAKVVDKCPGCGYGGLDMTETLWQELHGKDMSDGIFPISWHFA